MPSRLFDKHSLIQQSTDMGRFNVEQNVVEIEIGDETFEWKISGRSISEARDLGIDAIDIMAQVDPEANNVTMTLDSIYGFLWMGLVHYDDVTLEDVQELPMQVVNSLPMEKMAKSLADQTEVGEE